MNDYSHASLLELLQLRAATQPDEIFAVFPLDETTVTFQELLASSLQWADLLCKNLVDAVAPRVSIVAKKSKPFLGSYFGALLAGATVHVVDERIDVADMQSALSEFEPHVTICDAFGRGRAPENFAPSTRSIDLDISETLGFGHEELTNLVPVPGDAPAVCVFTSGSTGDPKGILSSHDNLLFAGACLRVHELDSSDRCLGLTPLSGTNGQVFALWAPLVTGGSTVQYQGMFNPFSALSWAVEHQATWMNGTPTYLALFTTHLVDRTDFDGHGLRFFRSASAPLPAEVQTSFEDHYGISIIETMGLSEMSGQVFANPARPSERKPGSVGQPFDSDLRIVDADGRPVAQGDVGELEVRSDGLMLGYFEDADATAAAVVDGWLRTGDLGFADTDGFVFIKGRKKDIAIVGGKNVSLREVDDVLYSIAGVELGTTIAVPDQVSGDRLVAIVQLAKGQELADDVTSVLFRERLSPYKRPAEVCVWEALPLGGSGKVLRAKAKAIYLQGNQS